MLFFFMLQCCEEYPWMFYNLTAEENNHVPSWSFIASCLSSWIQTQSQFDVFFFPCSQISDWSSICAHLWFIPNWSIPLRRGVWIPHLTGRVRRAHTYTSTSIWAGFLHASSIVFELKERLGFCWCCFSNSGNQISDHLDKKKSVFIWLFS